MIVVPGNVSGVDVARVVACSVDVGGIGFKFITRRIFTYAFSSWVVSAVSGVVVGL